MTVVTSSSKSITIIDFSELKISQRARNRKTFIYSQMKCSKTLLATSIINEFPNYNILYNQLRFQFYNSISTRSAGVNLIKIVFTSMRFVIQS